MHNGTDPERINKADSWLRDHLDGYVQWAQSHISLVVMTFDKGHEMPGNVFNRIFGFFWDEDESVSSESNHISTAFVGEMVKHGSHDQRIDQYSVLRIIEEMYGLSRAGSSADSSAISNVWK
jgi:hypothetical protein